MTRSSRRWTCLLSASLVTISAAFGQGAAFTYQGRLEEAGAPAGGTYDLRFGLFDAVIDGGQVGATVCVDGVIPVNGAFTVQLDFGASPFDGSNRWLEIGVRADAVPANCAGGSAFTTLSPRQPLTAVPYALRAFDSGHWALNGSAISNTNAGFVGVGRSTAVTSAEFFGIQAPVAVGYGGMYIRTEGATALPFYGYRSGDSQTCWSYLDGATGDWRLYVDGERLSVTDTGSVGIGTVSPASALHLVSGQAVARLESSSAVNGSVLVLQNETAAPTFVGAINFQNNLGATPGQIAYLANDELTFRVSGLERVRIDDDGDVGIGTTAPTSRLQIQGGSGVNGLAVNQTNASGGCGRFTVSNSGNANEALRAVHFGGGNGVYGETVTAAGVRGEATATSGVNFGLYGASASTSGRGVYGVAAASPVGQASYGVLGEELPGSFGFAVFAIGEVSSTGGKPFRIDHPDDPENKYLMHYAAESPEILNFYSGNVTLDAAGEATVELPSYFGKINRDPRYQLTPVGAPMPNLHVAAEICAEALAAGASAGPQTPAPACAFRIAGGAPGARVSWEVKAVRNDLYVRTRGAPVEVEKVGVEKGTYQHPEFYGKSGTLGFNYAARRLFGAREVEAANAAAARDLSEDGTVVQP